MPLRAALAAALVLAPGAPVSADAARRPCPSGYEHVSGQGCSRRSGPGWAVLTADGSEVETHGPDPGHREKHRPHDTGTTPTTGRQPVCSAGYRTVALYTYIATSSYDSAKPGIIARVEEMNGRINQESVESGGLTADLYVRCDEAGQVWVGQFPSAGTSYSDIVSAARAAGFSSSQEKYVIYAAFPSEEGWCGLASRNLDSSPGDTNANNVGPDYSVAYGWSCDLHEWAHGMGAVQNDAPHSSGAAHCNDELDEMCYADGGPSSAPYVACYDREHFDCNHDDYFDSAPEEGEYLASHWNLGTAWRWLRFGAESST